MTPPAAAEDSAAAPRDGAPARFAEFFAGIGLVQLGLAPGGWTPAYAGDIDPRKARMYRDHFGEHEHYHLGDIRDVDAVLQRLRPPVTLATASFPCVDLSLAGLGAGFGGERSSTYFAFIDVLRRMGADRPPLVMLENVAGFLTARGGADFDRAVAALAELGYFVDAVLLDARWFTPQSRPRVFVFGIDPALADAPELTRQRPGFALGGDPWSEAIRLGGALRPESLRRAMARSTPTTGWCAAPLRPPTPVAPPLVEVIDLDEHQPWWDPDATAKHEAMMEPPSRRRVEQARRAGETIVGTAFRRTRRGKPRLEVRFDLAGCLRTPRGGSARQIVLAVTAGRLRMRWMTAREYARLQGAPDYRFNVSATDAMFGFGDAVCVPAIAWLDAQLLTPLRRRIAPSPAPRSTLAAESRSVS